MVSAIVEWRARAWATFGVTPERARRVTKVWRRAWKSATRPASSVTGTPAASRSLVAWLRARAVKLAEADAAPHPVNEPQVCANGPAARVDRAGGIELAQGRRTAVRRGLRQASFMRTRVRIPTHREQAECGHGWSTATRSAAVRQNPIIVAMMRASCRRSFLWKRSRPVWSRYQHAFSACLIAPWCW